MSIDPRRSRKGWKRRDLFHSGSVAALAASSGSVASAAASPSPDVYTQLGVRPFINATATLTSMAARGLCPT